LAKLHGAGGLPNLFAHGQLFFSDGIRFEFLEMAFASFTIAWAFLTCHINLILPVNEYFIILT
jgi:hypothetical protein